MSIHTSRGTARFVSTSRLSILCGLLAIASSTIEAFAYVMKPKPRDLKSMKKYKENLVSNLKHIKYGITYFFIYYKLLYL